MINFLNENIRTAKFSNIPAHDIYDRLVKYCELHSTKPFSFREFNELMMKAGFKKIKDRYGKPYFKDVYLLKCKY